MNNTNWKIQVNIDLQLQYEERKTQHSYFHLCFEKNVESVNFQMKTKSKLFELKNSEGFCAITASQL